MKKKKKVKEDLGFYTQKVDLFLSFSGKTFREISFDLFFKWLENQSDPTSQHILINFANDKKTFFKSVMYLKRNLIGEFEKDLWELFLASEDTHIGTSYLTPMMLKIHYDYNFVGDRHKVYQIILKFRKQLPLTHSEKRSYIISGKVMKKYLNLKNDDKKIDGWCYTKNSKVILEFLKKEKLKHDKLSVFYNDLHSDFNSESKS